MLLYLDASLLTVGVFPPDWVEGINNIARGMWEGKHLVVGRPDDLTQIGKRSGISQEAKQVCHRAAAQFATVNGLLSDVSVWVNCTALATPTPVTRHLGVQRIIDVTPGFFRDTSRVQETVLLGENRDDGLVLSQMAHFYLRAVSRGSCRLAVDIRGGGGDTMAVELDALAQRNVFAVCVADSDRRFPSDSLGQTARKVQKWKDPASFPLIEVVETASRELENVLPIEFFEETYASDINHTRTVSLLRCLRKSGESVLAGYLDLKKGTRLELAFAAAKANPDRTQIKAEFQTVVGTELGLNLPSNPCWQADKCLTPNTCQCLVHVGNSDNILRAFNLKSTGQKPWERGRGRWSGDQAECMRLGKIVFDWACASAPIRS